VPGLADSASADYKSWAELIKFFKNEFLGCGFAICPEGYYVDLSERLV